MIDPSFIFDYITFVGSLLGIIPFGLNRIAIGFDAFIVIGKHTDIIIYHIKIFLDELK